MVSLDDSVLARMEKGGERYELLVDPEMVDDFKNDPDSVNIDDFLAMDEVFHDARGGERPTEEAIENTFGTQDILEIAKTILNKGSIQLTTNQRKAIVEKMRQKIIHHIHSQAVDPKTKSPHPVTRIELALEESRYSVDPFKKLELQIKDAVDKLNSFSLTGQSKKYKRYIEKYNLWDLKLDEGLPEGVPPYRSEDYDKDGNDKVVNIKDKKKPS